MKNWFRSFLTAIGIGTASRDVTKALPAMMNSSFIIGDRVLISETYHWAKGVKGAIFTPPRVVLGLSDWQGVSRSVDTRRGTSTFYWVYFDHIQFDADGDGPFIGAEIKSDFLQPTTDAPDPELEIVDEDVEAVWYQYKNTFGIFRVEFKAYIKGTLQGK